jgi:hypothetical protein
VATGSDLIEKTRRHLFSGNREEMNKLAADITASATSLATTYPLGGITAGAVLEIGTELIYVWAVDTTAVTATIKRAHLGSTAAAHTAGDAIKVNPKFPDFSIFDALNDEILDMSSPQNGLYQIAAISITYNPTYRGYDLTGVTDLLDVYEVRYESIGPERYWPLIDNWDVSRSMAASEFASGTVLLLSQGADPGMALRVRYKAPFTTLASSSANLTTTGLATTMYDIPPLGAAARLVAPREVKQGFSEHQGEPRRAQEVPPGTNLRSAQALLGLRDRRISAERARLHQLYPPRQRRVG